MSLHKKSARGLFFCVVIAFVELPATNTSANTSSYSIEKKYDDYSKATALTKSLAPTQRYRVAAQKYLELFSADQSQTALKRTKTKNIRLLFSAASEVTFYAPFSTHGKPFTADMALDLTELERRHTAHASEYAEMYKALVSTHQFFAARILYRKHKVRNQSALQKYLNEIPRNQNNAPTELIVSTKERTLIHRIVDVNKKAYILILVDPLCHFCSAFLRDMHAHTKFLKILEKHAIWITPPNGVLEFTTLQKWNRSHPNLTLGIVYRPAEWPMIKNWAVPTFYFIRNNKIIIKVVGWPNGGRITQLQSAMKKIGLSVKQLN